MNPPLTGLPVTPAVPATLSGAGINTELIQSDTGDSGGFSGLLNELYSALTPTPPQTATATPDGAELLAGLQELPQGGNLLPLLQQTLEGVADSGIDLEQFTERLKASLKSLLDKDAGLFTGQAPAEQLAQVLQPLVQQQPALLTVLPAEVVDALQRQPGQAVDRAGNDQLLRSLPASLPAQHKGPDSGAANPPAGEQSAAGREGARPFSLDSTVLPQPQGVSDTGAHDAELSTLISAIKRLAPDSNRPASAESTVVTATTATTSAGGSTAAAPAQAAPTVALQTPLGQADWDQALGERIQWLASQKIQGAQVRLNPSNLGPMEVRIQVQNDQATVHFSSQHAVVRDALEAALPRLRDMFEASGVELVDVDISGGSGTGQQQAAMHDSAAPHWGPASAVLEEEVGAQNSRQSVLGDFLGTGRLDLFA